MDLAQEIFDVVKVELLYAMRGTTIDKATAADKRHVAAISKNVTKAIMKIVEAKK